MEVNNYNTLSEDDMRQMIAKFNKPYIGLMKKYDKNVRKVAKIENSKIKWGDDYTRLGQDDEKKCAIEVIEE